MAASAARNPSNTSIGVPPGLAAVFTINGGTGNDTVNLNGDITFAAGKSLDVDLDVDLELDLDMDLYKHLDMYLDVHLSKAEF